MFQAQLLGKCLEKIPFTRAYASDYPRTFETAQIILRENEVSEESMLQGEKRIRERVMNVIFSITVMHYKVFKLVDKRLETLKKNCHNMIRF